MLVVGFRYVQIFLWSRLWPWQKQTKTSRTVSVFLTGGNKRNSACVLRIPKRRDLVRDVETSVPFMESNNAKYGIGQSEQSVFTAHFYAVAIVLMGGLLGGHVGDCGLFCGRRLAWNWLPNMDGEYIEGITKSSN